MKDAELYTDGELAQLCLAVYNNSSDNLTPQNWVRVYEYENTSQDFYAACYFKNVDSEGFPTCVAVAYRGTVITSVPNLLGDLELALGKIPQQAFVIGDFIKNLQNELYTKLDLQDSNRARKFIQIPWVLTGHSLGACLAEYSLMIGLIFGANAVAYQTNVVTFENPGSLLFIENGLGPNNQQFLAYIRSKCKTIQTDVNIINTCNPQVGQVFTIVDYPYNFNVFTIPTLSLITSDYKTNPNYLWYSLDLHGIAGIADYLYTKKIDALRPVDNYPAGFRSGYKSYLSPQRFVYWKQYAEEIWDTNPAVHVTYKDFDDYYTNFVTALKKIYDDAPSSLLSAVLAEEHSPKEEPIVDQQVRGFITWKLLKAKEIAESFKQCRWSSWNAQAKSEMISEAVKTVEEAVASGHCNDKTPERIFSEVKSKDGKTLYEALGWQRFWSLSSDENRETADSLKIFKASLSQ